MGLSWALLIILAAEPHPAAVEIRVERPDIQLKRLLDLFEGTGQSGPASVLAAWRQAADRPTTPPPPSKSAQGLLTLLNSRMVPEFRNFSGLRIWIDPQGEAGWRWGLLVPHDDGTLSAVATALALTDGAPGPPIGGMQTDRLAGPDSPWMGRRGDAIVVSGDREGLAEFWNRRGLVDASWPDSPGYHARIDFPTLSAGSSPNARRVGDMAQALGLRNLSLQADLRNQALQVEIRGLLNEPDSVAPERVEPAWVDDLPGDASAAIFFALSPSGATLDRLFSALDHAVLPEKGEPRPAPARVRLNLLANLAGVRPEIDLWPHLRGLSAFARIGDDGRPDRSVLVLHVDSESSAHSLAERVVPRLLKGLRQSANVRRDGFSVLIARDEPSVAWVVEARHQAEHPAADSLREQWTDRPVSRGGAVWPGRWPGWIEQPTVASAVQSAPPVVWWGRREGSQEIDHLKWPDLKSTVGRWVSAVPGTR